MRVLHIVNSAQTGGAETLIEALARQARPEDDVHILVLLGEGTLSERYARVAASVTYVGMSPRGILPLRAMRAVRRIVARERIDVVHSHLLQSDLVNELTPHRARRVSTLHTSGGNETRALSRLVGRVVALLSGRFDAVVACSVSAKEHAARAGYRDATGIPVTYNGTQLSAPGADAARSARFVSLARWHVMKDHRTLFAALDILRRTHPEARLDCAGWGMTDTNPDLIALFDELPVRDLVTLHGPVNTVRELLRGAAALVLSSSHAEALPMAGIEALSESVPVVTTAVGDCPVFVLAPGEAVAPRSAERLAAEMARVLDIGDEGYRDWQRRSRALAEARFDERTTASAYRSLYERLLAT